MPHPVMVGRFSPERGTDQGDTSSHALWVVFFDIVLRALELENSDPFFTIDLSGNSYPVPDCSFVDDLMSLTSILAGWQRKADMMGLTIARSKLRVFSMDWSLNARQNRNRAAETITIHDMMGGNNVLTVKRAGTVKCLGALFDTGLTGKA